MKDRELELSPQEMHRMVDLAMQRIVHHIESLPNQPSSDVDGAQELARSLVEPVPREGQPYEEILKLLFEKAIPKSFTTPGPGYLAYIPGGGIFHSAVADLIANATNRFVTVWQAAPGVATLEANVVRWFSDMMGYGKGSGGFLTSGGSLANFSALVTARREKLPENFLKGTIYASDQVHHCIVKSATLAGFPEKNIRKISCDEFFRIRTDFLQQQIEKDRAAGFTPFLVVGSAGTTNTGAVDDLSTLAEISKRENCWFHVDGAYGGFFMLTEHGRKLFRGIERADSIVLDPHKGMFLPYGCGCLLVKDAGALKRAHSVGAAYLPKIQEDSDFVDFTEISPELSRDFRGLRVWLPLKMHGIEPFRENLEEKLELTRWAVEQLGSIPEIEIVAKPQLTVTAFRLMKKGLDSAQLNELNQDFLNRINQKKRIFLSGTTLGEKFVLRICILSFRTHRDRMEQGMEDICKAAIET